MYRPNPGELIPPRRRRAKSISSALSPPCEKLKTLTARNALAERKIAELTMDLTFAKETLEFLQKENNFASDIPRSHDNEISRQSQTLTEAEVAVKEGANRT